MTHHSVRQMALRPLTLAFLWLAAACTAPGQGMLEVEEPATSTPVPDDTKVQLAFEASDEDSLTDDQVRLVDYQHRISKRIDRYVEVDFLLWWAGDSTLPPLLTTNPIGTPLADVGLLGGATTSILNGNETVGGGLQSGIRARLGRYLRGSVASRVELGLWVLFPSSDTFNASSTGGDPILSRPFINAVTGDPDSQIISFPGEANGSFSSEYSRQAIGVDPLVFFCLYGDGCNWLEFFSGYRFLWLQDELTLRERVELEPGGLIAPGTRFDVTDRFRAENFYHLLPLGLSYSRNSGSWNLNLRGDIGIGLVSQRVTIRGNTDSFIGDTFAGSEPAGLLALSTNSGVHERTRFAVVPQFSLSGRYSLTDRWSANIGYSLMILNNAVSAVDHVPTVIDPANIPPAIPAGGPDPRFTFVEELIVLHGFNFGLRFDY